MGEEERAALYRQQRVECRANLAANERRLAGSVPARAGLVASWEPLRLALLERQLSWPDDATVCGRTPSNRGCIV